MSCSTEQAPPTWQDPWGSILACTVSSSGWRMRIIPCSGRPQWCTAQTWMVWGHLCPVSTLQGRLRKLQGSRALVLPRRSASSQTSCRWASHIALNRKVPGKGQAAQELSAGHDTLSASGLGELAQAAPRQVTIWRFTLTVTAGNGLQPPFIASACPCIHLGDFTLLMGHAGAEHRSFG